MTGDTLWRKWQEIRNKLRNSIISSSNIAQDSLHKLPSGQGLKDAYFKFVCNIYKQSFQKKNPICQIMIDGVDLPGQSTSIWCCGACFSMRSSDVQELIRQHEYS